MADGSWFYCWRWLLVVGSRYGRYGTLDNGGKGRRCYRQARLISSCQLPGANCHGKPCTVIAPSSMQPPAAWKPDTHPTRQGFCDECPPQFHTITLRVELQPVSSPNLWHSPVLVIMVSFSACPRSSLLFLDTCYVQFHLTDFEIDRRRLDHGHQSPLDSEGCENGPAHRIPPDPCINRVIY